MSRLLCKRHLGLLVLGLGILLTGCNSLTGNKQNFSEELPKKLDISKEFPKKLVASNIQTLIEQNIKQIEAEDIEKFSSCMAPLIEGKGLTGKINLIPELFGNLGKIPHDNASVDFSSNKSLFHFIKGEGITDSDSKNPTEVLNKLWSSKKSEGTETDKQTLSLSPFKRFLNFDLTLEMLGELHKNDENRQQLIEKEKQLILVIELYLEAYFSSAIGNVEQVMSKSLEEVNQKISEEIKKVSNSSNKSGLNSALENLERVAKEGLKKASEEIKSSSNSTDKSGFVAGDGSKYSFSALSNVDGKLSIDHNQIGADIVRIFLEAIRDVFYPLPVSKDSTLALNQKEKDEKNKIKNLNVIVFSEGEGKEDWEKYKSKITADKFNKIVTKAKQSEAAIATVVGKAIRGGFVGSLNNEALAKTIETATGVVARLTRERFEWCSTIAQNDNDGQKTSEIDSVLLTGL